MKWRSYASSWKTWKALSCMTNIINAYAVIVFQFAIVAKFDVAPKFLKIHYHTRNTPTAMQCYE